MLHLLTATNYSKDSIASLFANQTISYSSWLTILVSILLAFGVGMFIFWVYRTNYRGVMYNNNFGMTLILMTLITTPVVMCIRDSIQLSMGMVGALSIVRFRTAVKDPLDTAYMFWALTMGILLGAGQFFLAALALACIAGLIILCSHMNFRKMNAYLLVIHYNPAAEAAMRNHVAVDKIVELEKLEATTEEITQTLMVIARQNNLTMEQLKDIYNAEFEAAVMKSVLTSKVMRLIRDAADVVEE